jgi:hypothetical protein
MNSRRFTARCCPMPPVLSTERIAHLSYGKGLLRCGISIPAKAAQGQTEKNSFASKCLPVLPQ